MCHKVYASFHDIGKVFISKGIIQKAEPLTQEEFEQVKTHSRVGYDYIMPGNLHMLYSNPNGMIPQ